MLRFDACTLLIAVRYFTGCDAPALDQTGCPCDAETWAYRAKVYNCRNPKYYTCLPDKQGNLVETCMFLYKITEYEDGCPVIEDYKQGFGLQIGIQHTKCDIPRCPKKESKFNIANVYMYPSCFIPVQLRSNHTYQKELRRVCMSQVPSLVEDCTKIKMKDTLPKNLKENVLHPDSCPYLRCCIAVGILYGLSLILNIIMCITCHLHKSRMIMKACHMENHIEDEKTYKNEEDDNSGADIPLRGRLRRRKVRTRLDSVNFSKRTEDEIMRERSYGKESCSYAFRKGKWNKTV